MTYSMQPIIKHLFQADTLEDVTRERLEAFVEEYPSFGIGHYLLSRKLRSADGAVDHFPEETRRTNLYFTNPFWLQWLLENTTGNVRRDVPAERPITESLTKAPLTADPAAIPEEPAAAPEEQASIPLMQLAEQQEIAEPLTAIPIPGQEEPMPEQEELIPASDEPTHAPEEPIPMPEGSAHTPEEPIRDEEPPFILEEAPPGEEENTGTAGQLLHSIREAQGLRESLQRINEGFVTGTGEGTEAAAEPMSEPEDEPDQEDQEEEKSGPGSETAFPGNAIGATLERAAREAGIGAEANGQKAAETTAQKSQDDSPISFEPYHTIDYFASQGIKLSQEEIPNDTLGRQLKSFTDWLKVMRKLPQKEREIVPDIAAERNIQTIAAHSIQGKEVVTETMAEVLVKQGMPEKAREVYEKLSLLNPGKRAYFAAKIEQLNIN